MAALLVVYFHAVLQIPHVGPDPAVVPGLPVFGKAGVDVFFVLSGLLIWSSTQGQPQTIPTFYRKRLLRIVPLYWLLTLLVAATALAAPSALRSTRFDAAHLLASLLFLPWPNPASNGSPQDLMTPPIVPGWTLNFEIFFYFVFGICLLVPIRFRLPGALVIFGLATVPFWVFGDESLIAGFYDPGLIAEFTLGLCLGYALERRVRVPAASAWLLLAAALDLLILLDWADVNLHRLVTSGLPATLLLFSLAMLEARDRWPRFTWLVGVGDATYSLYLTHIFVLAGLRMILGRLGASLETLSAQVAFVGLAMGLSVAVGLAAYHGLEKPLGRALRSAGLLRRPQAVVPALAGRNGRR